MKASLKNRLEDALIERLLARQPSAKETVALLRRHFAGKSGYGIFAPIIGTGCGACRVSVAKARLARVAEEGFISCANCGRFLYLPTPDPADELPRPA